MKRILLLVFAICLIFAPVAIAADKPVVGLILRSLANEFFDEMKNGAVKFQKEDGTFELIIVGTKSETDIETQINAMENFIARHVDMIVLAPSDSVELVPSVKKAVDAGIPVLNIDVRLDRQAIVDNGLPEDFLFVGPNNALGAELVGKTLGEKIGKGAPVLIIEGNPGTDNAQQRHAGFMKAADVYGFNVLESVTAHWEAKEANSIVVKLLRKYPKVKGILCANDSMAIGAVNAVRSLGLTEQVTIVGFDNIEACQDLIRKGRIFATVDQFGSEMAVNAIKVGFRIMRGEEITGWEKTPIEIITKESLGGR